MSNSYYDVENSGDYDKFNSPQILTVKPVSGSQTFAGSVTASKFVVKGGTDSQVLYANGSVGDQSVNTDDTVAFGTVRTYDIHPPVLGNLNIGNSNTDIPKFGW